MRETLDDNITSSFLTCSSRKISHKAFERHSKTSITGKGVLSHQNPALMMMFFSMPFFTYVDETIRWERILLESLCRQGWRNCHSFEAAILWFNARNQRNHSKEGKNHSTKVNIVRQISFAFEAKNLLVLNQKESNRAYSSHFESRESNMLPFDYLDLMISKRNSCKNVSKLNLSNNSKQPETSSKVCKRIRNLHKNWSSSQGIEA